RLRTLPLVPAGRKGQVEDGEGRLSCPRNHDFDATAVLEEVSGLRFLVRVDCCPHQPSLNWKRVTRDWFTGPSTNGRSSAFGALCLGSNPSGPARKQFPSARCRSDDTGRLGSRELKPMATLATATEKTEKKAHV